MPQTRGINQEHRVWIDSVTQARCCSCSTFLSSAEKTKSDPDNWRSCEKVPNVSVGLLCDSLCSERMSELGHFTIENLHKFFLLGWNREGCEFCNKSKHFLFFSYSLFPFYKCRWFVFFLANISLLLVLYLKMCVFVTCYILDIKILILLNRKHFWDVWGSWLGFKVGDQIGFRFGLGYMCSLFGFGW